MPHILLLVCILVVSISGDDQSIPGIRALFFPTEDCAFVCSSILVASRKTFVFVLLGEFESEKIFAKFSRERERMQKPFHSLMQERGWRRCCSASFCPFYWIEKINFAERVGGRIN